MTIVRVLFLTVIWTVMWSDLSFANVASGLVVAVTIVASLDTWQRGTVVIRPVHALRFAVFFLFKLVQSSIVVARTVIVPRDRVRAGIVAVPLHGCSDAIATLIADAISLTPGTLTLEVRRDPLVLYVHALDTRDIDGVRRDVYRLELLAVRAFGDKASIAAIAADENTVWRAS
jgi:multicomponent Na+:H+ antiporter subunit E